MIIVTIQSPSEESNRNLALMIDEMLRTKHNLLYHEHVKYKYGAIEKGGRFYYKDIHEKIVG